MRQPRVPRGTGETRRYLATGLDCYLCLLVVGLLLHSCLGATDAGAGRTAAVLVGQLTVLSFANQVLLTMAVRASAGKLIMGVRVIRLPDAGRPEFRRLVLRWLYGLLWLPLQPWHHLRRATAEPPPRNRPGGCPRAASSPTDLAGVRHVRRSDLRYYRAAVAGGRRG
ncbi:RDD family protein [Kitasatospora albolonga]